MKEKILNLLIRFYPNFASNERVANEILQLRIECPDTEEIKAEAQKYAPLNGWEKDAFKAGANYIKNEIAKRNQ